MRYRRAGLPPFFLYLNALLIIGAAAAFGFTTGAITRLHTLMPEQIRQRGWQPPLITEVYSPTAPRRPGRSHPAGPRL